MSQFGRMSLSSNQTTLGVYFEKKNAENFYTEDVFTEPKISYPRGR